MADLADIAFGIEAEHIARSLANIVADIPEGIAGECDDCGAEMPRLVEGRCGFCRDGRRPPLSFFDADRAPPATVVIPAVAAMEAVEMSATVSDLPSRKIAFEGSALQAIEDRAERQDLTYKLAAVELILLGVSASDDAAFETEIVLANVPDAALAAEVARRLTEGPGSDDFDAAVARADAAEAKLATLRAALAE